MTGPSWRLYAVELRRAQHVEGDSLITELGANPGRILFVGVVTSMTDRGVEARDHTGSLVFTLTRRTEVGEVDVPGYALIHGNLRASGEQRIFADYVLPADEALRNEWTAEALLLMWERLEAIEEAIRSGVESASKLMAYGYSEFASNCAERALRAYGSVDASFYRGVIRATALAVLGEGETGLPLPTPESADPQTLVLNIIRAKGGEVPYEDILDEASKRGLDRVSVDAALDALLDSGEIEEVGLNVFRVKGR